MRILSIESSCDETGAAVVEKNGNTIKVLSNTIASSSDMHAATGGIIPENAAREQVKSIIPVIINALLKYKNIKPVNNQEDFVTASRILKEEIDTIAVTYGPGLIGSLIIGVETTKTLSYAFKKPIIPVNHLLAHLYANFIAPEKLNPKSLTLDANVFPFIGLIVSGGHTDLLYFKSHTDFKWLGGTRDDAAGEAIDKIGRMLNLPYPAGPEMEKRAKNAKDSHLKFQSPMIGSKDYDFSFSGLKAETMRFVKNNTLSEELKDQICYAVQSAIFKVLIKKTLEATTEYSCDTVLLGGGVSASSTLLESMKYEATSLAESRRGIKNQELRIFSPEKQYATDNAAMIGAYALINGEEKNWKEFKSNPELYFA